MGNCICFLKFSGSPPSRLPPPSELQQMIRVVTSTGGIMELYAPITADSITDQFPGHRLFRSSDLLSTPPLPHNEHLHPGHLYYLLPISDDHRCRGSYASSPRMTPYRMSFDQQRWVPKRSEPDLYPRCRRAGVWKVRLVINPEQLTEILSQEARTQELIESVRTVAKCGGVNQSSDYCCKPLSSDKVTFKEPEAAFWACQNPAPLIDDRRANCNLAFYGAHNPKPPPPPQHDEVAGPLRSMAAPGLLAHQHAYAGSSTSHFHQTSAPLSFPYLAYGYIGYSHDMMHSTLLTIMAFMVDDKYHLTIQLEQQEEEHQLLLQDIFTISTRTVLRMLLKAAKPVGLGSSFPIMCCSSSSSSSSTTQFCSTTTSPPVASHHSPHIPQFTYRVP